MKNITKQFLTLTYKVITEVKKIVNGLKIVCIILLSAQVN